MKAHLKQLIRAAWLLAMLGVFLPMAQAQAPAGPKVAKIEIKSNGPQAASDELVRANVRIKVGEPYLRTQADDDVRTLYATGYFYNIRIVEEFTADGVVLTYVLQGKPVLMEIALKGNKEYSNSRLMKKVTSKVGEPLNERKLFTDAQEIQKYYQKQGYQGTKAKYTVNIDEASGRGTATIEITEAPKVRVVDVVFEGATVFKQKTLRGELKTRRWWMWSWLTGSGKLKDDEFADDQEKLAEFYRNKGYIDFELKEVKTNYLKPTRMELRLVINEGVQYKVGSIDFKGNTLFTGQELLAKMPLSVGQTFTPSGYFKNLEHVQDKYGGRGYVDARVAAQRVPNTEKGTMDLVFNIDEKQQSFIEKIEIKGNLKTKDRVLRRELAVSPGEVFDMTRVKLSTNRLNGLNYFSKVDARPEPTDPPIAGRKNLVVSVEEKNTGNFSIGAGFSTVDSVFGVVELSQGNFDLFNPPYFTGAGQKIRLRAQAGTQRQDYSVNFIEPWFLGRRLALGVDLFHREFGFQSELYNETHTGTRVSLSRALNSEFLIGSVSYGLERISINNLDPTASPEILVEQGTDLISRIGSSLTYDTRNNSLLPDRGQKTELSGDIALGDIRDYHLEVKTAWYFRGFFPGHILEISGRAGVADSFDDSRVPLYDRYFLGGLYSLRGFSYRKVGPKDVNNEPVGGRTYYFGSAEYSVPIISMVRFAVFYDIGMVFEKSWSTSQNGRNTGYYNDNVGFGFRLNLPIGPLRFDYGIPLQSDAGNVSNGKFQFGVGYTREF